MMRGIDKREKAHVKVVEEIPFRFQQTARRANADNRNMAFQNGNRGRMKAPASAMQKPSKIQSSKETIFDELDGSLFMGFAGTQKKLCGSGGRLYI